MVSGHRGTAAQGHRRARCGAGIGTVGRALGVAGLALVAGCELKEVMVPLGEETVAVHAMLTLDSTAAMQYVIVERSIIGTAEIPDRDSLRGPPRPPLPVLGATVVVTRDDSVALRYSETTTPGVYGIARDETAGFLVPGRAYRLQVDLPDGRQVRGRTRMPAFPVVTGMPAAGATFDRDRDTLRLRWTGAAGTDEIYVQVRPRDLQRRVTLVLITDSSSVTIPGLLPLPVIGDSLPPSVWVAGTYQTLTVAAIDTNYFDHVRTASDPFTGSGFLNHLEGGIGVFGAVAPVNRTVAVRGTVDQPYEGRYALRARLGADSLEGTVELYVTRERPEPILVSGLVTGTTWPVGEPRTSAPLGEVEAGGQVGGGLLRLRVLEGGTRELGILEGVFNATGSTGGVVRGSHGQTIGSFVLTRLAP